MRYQFADFEFDADERTLTQTGRRIDLQPKCIDVLAYLLAHPNRLLTRDQILGDVWGPVVVTPNALTRVIRLLRQALNDDAEAPQLIETVTGSGYRFIGSLKGSTGDSTRRRVWPFIWAVAAMLFGVGVYVALERPSDSAPTLAIVLPEASSDPNDYSRAVLREVRHELSRMDNLHVVRDVTSADYSLEGDIGFERARVRGSLRLRAMAEDEVVWRHDYDDVAIPLSSVPTDTAVQLVEFLPMPSSDRAHIRPIATHSFSAYESYLRAELYFDEFTPQSMRRAVTAYEAAIALDNDFEPPKSRRALALFMLAQPLRTTATGDEYAKHITSARQAGYDAVSSDPTSAEAHFAVGQILALYDWNWAGANRAHELAIYYKPSWPDAYAGYAIVLALQHRFDEALEHAEQASHFASQDASSLNALAESHLYAGDWEAATRHFQEIARLDSRPGRAHYYLAMLARLQGDWPAFFDLRTAQIGRRPVALETALANGSDRDVYLHMLQRTSFPGERAKLFAQLGEFELAMAELEHLYQLGERGALAFTLVQPDLSRLRQTPAYDAFATRIGLIPSAAEGKAHQSGE